MIPAYPVFRQIEKEDKPIFVQAFKINPPEISEFTFTNLFAWRKIYRFQISQLGGFIIISLQQDGNTKFFNPIGDGDIGISVEKILKDKGGEFVRLPDKAKAIFENNHLFSIEPDRNNADYLYNTKDLVELKGKKYDAKRNFIKKFKAKNQYEYLKLREDNIQECLDFEEVWCSAKSCDSIKSLNDERQAFKEMLLNYSAFNLIGGVMKIKDRMAAVILAEPLSPRTLVLHIMKADPDIGGLYQTVLNEFLTRESLRYDYVNMEQDLGVPGLRKAKLSYQPARILMKYTLRLKG